MRARKKPVVIETVIFEGGTLGKDNTPFDQIYETGEAFSEFPEWLKQAISEKVIQVKVPYSWEIGIKTLEGVMTVRQGDYIIKGVNGELYPCKPDIFEKTYDILN